MERDRLLAGEYPGARDPDEARARIQAFIDAGITTFIDLTEATERLAPYAPLLPDAGPHGKILHHRFAFRDVSVPASESLTEAILDTIDAHLAEGRRVYLHGRGGIGRTGTIVGCWLARHGYRGRRGLARVRELWKACPKSVTRQTPDTPEQEAYILDWSARQSSGSPATAPAPFAAGIDLLARQAAMAR